MVVLSSLTVLTLNSCFLFSPVISNGKDTEHHGCGRFEIILFGCEVGSHLHMQVLCNNTQSEEANGLHLLVPARQEQAKEFTHVLGTKVLPPTQQKTEHRYSETTFLFIPSIRA